MTKRRFTRLFSAFVAVVLLAGVAVTRSDAQSEYLSGMGMPYAAYDRLPGTEIESGGGVVDVRFAPGRVVLPRETVLGWIRMSAQAVTTYYGHAPAKRVKLLIVPVDGRGVQGGTTWGYRGAAIRIKLGSDASEDDLRRDWIMVHEMVHVALPDLDERYSWLSEGLAVYVEPIARAQAGQIQLAGVWGSMVRGMPNGLPGGGDRGLDNTPTWGRTYWGGAIFCLMADIEIRKRTDNAKGLQDAMRGVLAAGGNHETRSWPLKKVFQVADAATGTNVLSELYGNMGEAPMDPDLPSIWQKLGVSVQDGRVVFDDSAPLAAIRVAITKPPAT